MVISVCLLDCFKLAVIVSLLFMAEIRQPRCLADSATVILMRRLGCVVKGFSNFGRPKDVPFDSYCKIK